VFHLETKSIVIFELADFFAKHKKAWISDDARNPDDVI